MLFCCRYQAKRDLVTSNEHSTTAVSPPSVDAGQPPSEFLRVHAKISQTKSASWPHCDIFRHYRWLRQAADV